MCNAADGIDRAVTQIDLAIAIEVDAPLPDGARHELRQADGARVRPQHAGWCHILLVAEGQELPQLGTEEGAAITAPLRKIEAQGGQGIQYPEITHLTAINGFNTQDARDDVCRHTVELFGTLQGRRVLTPEAHTGFDSDGLDKAASIKRPVFAGGGRRRHHQLGHAFFLACFRQGGPNPLRVKLIFRSEGPRQLTCIAASGVTVSRSGVVERQAALWLLKRVGRSLLWGRRRW